MMLEYQQFLDDNEPGASQFQLDYFVTIKTGGGTDYGRYKQACREIARRHRACRDMLLENELLSIEIRELEDKIKNAIQSIGENFELSKNKVFLLQKKNRKKDIDQTIETTQKELKRFACQATGLKGNVGDVKTPKNRQYHEREMWTFNLKRQAAVEIMTTGRITAGTLEAILALPAQAREYVLGIFSNHLTPISESVRLETRMKF